MTVKYGPSILHVCNDKFEFKKQRLKPTLLAKIFLYPNCSRCLVGVQPPAQTSQARKSYEKILLRRLMMRLPEKGYV